MTNFNMFSHFGGCPNAIFSRSNLLSIKKSYLSRFQSSQTCRKRNNSNFLLKDHFPNSYFGDLQPSVFNSLTSKKEILDSLDKQKILTWYSCGPTVYDHSHLGHARNYLCLDLIQRILSDYFGYSILHVMGITDVDDKIIKKSQENCESSTKLAKHFECEFLQDLFYLNIRPPLICTRVTEHIPDILCYIEQIMQNGYAYIVEDKSVYFDTVKLGNAYGKLKPDKDTVYESPDPHPFKRNSRDFVLWKSTCPGSSSGPVHSNEFSWKSRWSQNGRPGWHIECTAMSDRYLGRQIDVHWGGIDLMYPHHNNEIAQADAYHSSNINHDEWVRYFLHSGHLHIEGLKMSKSLKNFITIREFFEDENNTPDEFRMFCINVHYRSNVNFSVDRIVDSRRQLKKFQVFFEMLDEYKARHIPPKHWDKEEYEVFKTLEEVKQQINLSLCDDFNTSRVIKLLLDLITTVNRYNKDTKERCCPNLLIHIENYFKKILTIFGFTFHREQRYTKSKILSEMPNKYLYSNSSASILHEVLPSKIPMVDHVSLSSLSPKKTIISESEMISTNNSPSQEAVSQPMKTESAEYASTKDHESKGDSDHLLKLVNAVVGFRSELRKLLTNKDNNHSNDSVVKKALQLCDKIRDQDLYDLGYKVIDLPDLESVVYLVDSKERKQDEEWKLNQLKKAQINRERELKRLEIVKIPSNQFLIDSEKYSKYDSDGIPTHDKENRELSKSAIKKLKKEWEKHAKAHEHYLSSIEKKGGGENNS